MRRLLTIVLLVGFQACAFATGGAPPAAPPPSSDDVDRAVAALQRAEAQLEEGRLEEAAAAGDSLFASWQDRSNLAALADRALWLSGRSQEALGFPGPAADRYQQLVARARDGRIRDEALGRLVGVLADTGREPEAVAVVLENPGVLDELGRDDFRQWVSALSIDRLRGFTESTPPTTTEATIVHMQLAQLLMVDRQPDEARRIASGVLAGNPAPPERAVAELIVSEGGDLTGRAARIGAILPMTGELSNIGELLSEGIQLAVDGYRRAVPDGVEIELLIRDDGSDPENTRRLVESLEDENVVAIIGPLRSESFAAAARARRNPRLPLISPTATEVFRPSPNAYTLYDLATRERDVAVDLARWTVEDLGLDRVAVLEPARAGLGGAVSAFVSTVRDAGGTVVARESFDPTLTTFREPIEAIAAASPDVVFAPATTTPLVLSVAPQLFYYGLHDAVVVGSEAWADPAAVRRLEPFAANHRIVGMTTDRLSPGTRWQQFVNDYERTYRKSLRDNILPALSYDATALVLAALEGGRLPIAAALAAYLETGPEINGVTGRLRPDAERSTVRRSTEIRMLLEGGFQAVDRSELLNWLAEVRARPSPFAPRDTIPR